MSSRPSSRSGGGSERQYQQDFIARIRYQNQLPPPPIPPKLLDIPNNAAAEYTSTNFVSRLAREQALNIEVDSELGMPMDLLPFGPEIFSLNTATANAVLRAGDARPTIHENDKPLLRSFASLGKPTRSTAGVSFLRRTEYISSENTRSTFKSTTSKDLIQHVTRHANNNRKEDPVAILKELISGFDTANPPDGKQWKLPVHPTKPHLKAVDSWPVLPDLASRPDGTGYVIVKLSTNPVSSTTFHDPGLDRAVLVPWNETGSHEDIKFDYYLPDTQDVSHNVKRKYSEVDTSDDGYTHVTDEGSGYFKYKRVRAYEFVTNPQERPNTYGEVLLTMDDGEGKVEKQRAAYFSPIYSRYNLRPMRTKDVEDSGDRSTVLEVRYRSLTEDEANRIQSA